MRAGEVHALMGENGAGKSTLMKILFGVQPPDSGSIEIAGRGEVKIEDPRHALALGIRLVSQEPSLIPQLDVAQNVFLGQTEALNIVPRSQFQEKAREIIKPLAPRLPVTAKVSSLGMADMQVVEIARTLARGGQYRLRRAHLELNACRARRLVRSDPEFKERAAGESSTLRTVSRRSTRSLTGSPCCGTVRSWPAELPTM